MNSNLMVVKKSTLSFNRPNGEINIKGLCHTLGVDKAKLPQVIGTNRQTVSYYFSKEVNFIKLRAAKIQTFFYNLNLVYELIRATMDKDVTKKQIVGWFVTPNRALEMKSPIELIYTKKIDVLIRKLKDVLYASHGA